MKYFTVKILYILNTLKLKNYFIVEKLHSQHTVYSNCFLEKSPIREKLNLSTGADKKPRYQEEEEKNKKINLKNVSHVTYHISPMQTVTATDPPPAISPTMYSRLVHQHRTETQKVIKNPKHGVHSFATFASCSSTKSFQLSCSGR